MTNYFKISNNKRLLIKLLNGYFSETQLSNEDDLTLRDHKLKLKACLCLFFDYFTRRIELRNELANLSMSYIDIAFSDPSFSIKQVQNVAYFFYYYSYKTVNMRPTIISSIIDRIFVKIRNQFLVEKWIDVLVVFDVNPCDLDPDEKAKSIQVLTSLNTKLEKLIVRNNLFY